MPQRRKAMTKTVLITRCPNCDTSFRVTDVQLAVASGSVRCGACLQVFSALEHMLPGALSHDAASLLVADDAAGVANVDVPDLETALEEVLIDAALPTDEDSIADFDHEDEIDIDADVTLEPQFAADLIDSVRDEYELQDPVSQGASEDDDNAETTLDAGADSEAFVPDIRVETDPTELVGEWVPPRPKLSRVWIVGTGLLCLGLVFQYGWFNRFQLATTRLGPVYDLVCDRITCGLPEFSDISLIRATDLVVRTHPKIPKALIIDAIMVNRADQRQRFPDVEFRFADMNDKLIAARVFSSTEYLQGEMSGLKFMPPHTEVRISLEIVDPGSLATNYSLNIR